MKKLFLLLLMMSNVFVGFGWSQNLEILPETKSDVGKDVQTIGEEGGKVWDNYNDVADKHKNDLGAQFASGALTWDSILEYIVYLIRFLSQVGIFIGAVMIVYAGYIYASYSFTGKDPSAGKTAIKNAITGVVVITFSYAIMKAVTAAFLT